MTEYAVYLDDSGHPDDQPYIVVAGFLSTEEKWLAFEKEWKVALDRYRLGSVFHMVDFERAKRKDRGKVLESLTAIISKHTMATFCIIVEMKGYRKVNEIYPLEECIGTPYAIATRTLATQINHWKKKFFKPGDHLLVFVEDGAKHKGDMEETFRRDLLPVPQTVPKAHPSVQPADLLAWESLHYAKYENPRRSLRNLLADTVIGEGIMREENLLRSCKVAKLSLRQDIPPNLVYVHHSSPNRIRKRTIK